jgi:hypothetical protein
VREKVRGEYRVSSLVKQNKKAKICFVIHRRIFLIVKQIFYKRPTNHYFPATSFSVACHLLVEAGIRIVQEQSHPVRFELGQLRCSTNIVTVMEVTAVPNEALRAIWAGSRMVGGKRIACEEGQGDGEEEQQTDNIATLLPTNDYSSDILQGRVQIWQILGVEEADIHEVILLAAKCYLPDWRGDEVQNWCPDAPRPLRRVWEGTGAGQGQIRLRGELIQAHDRNTHQLREVFAVSGRQAFETSKTGRHHYLPAGAERSPRQERLKLGIPGPDLLSRMVQDTSDTEATMLELELAWSAVMAEKDVGASTMRAYGAWERMSSVCIRFEQLQAPRQADAAVATRQQIRAHLVHLLNEIQSVCGSDAAPFASTDVRYLAYVDREGRLAELSPSKSERGRH